jgi:pSer/pThr/pTyr-binding forkhead associated (FHA) protein
MLRCIASPPDPRVPRLVPLMPLVQRLRVGSYERVVIRVGRHPHNNIHLDSDTLPLLLSRFHAMLVYDSGTFSVVDQHTTNGTYVRRPARRRPASCCLQPAASQRGRR